MKEAPLRTVTQLIERGLAPAEERAELEKVAQRYAVTVPPASGIALGFDRLVMLAAGAQRIEQVLWSAVPEPASK